MRVKNIGLYLRYQILFAFLDTSVFLSTKLDLSEFLEESECHSHEVRLPGEPRTNPALNPV